MPGPENSWVMYLPNGKRIIGRGNPCNDKYFTKFLKGQEVYGMIKRMIKKYRIEGEPVLLDANDSGFKFVKGDVAHLTDRIALLLQQLVDSYRVK